MGAGHVGWGFDFDLVDADCGSVENPRGTPSSDPASMGFWDSDSDNPVPLMLLRAYDDAKYVDLLRAEPARAYEIVLWVSQQSYSVIGRNCLDDVYDVLRAYGVQNLPPPSHNWLPTEWFWMYTDSQFTHLASFVWSDRPLTDLMLDLSPRNSVIKQLVPTAPKWRVPGTQEWHDLQAQLAAASSRAPIREHAMRTPFS
jgi:hypothetical protein